MPDLHYEHPRLAAIYDADNGWSLDRDFYLALAGPQPQRILELGCGTGLLSRAFAARGHLVTAADPALSMIDAGRREPHGDAVEWVKASAQEFRSDRRFDLISMTGHAFQVLLSDEEIDGALLTMAGHIAESGRVVFESRNPAIDWPAKWTRDPWTVETPAGPVRQSLSVDSWIGDLLTFHQHFDFGDETLTSTSTLRFLDAAEIETSLTKAGLRVERLLGDWRDGAFDATTSEEMVFVTRLASDES